MSDHIIRGGPIRARELRESIAELGFERGVVVTLERFMDEYAEHRQRLRALTELVDSVINQMGQFTTIASGIQNVVDQLKRERDLSQRLDEGHG